MALTQKLTALETETSRQLVVATIPDLQDYDIADYGYRLGREWGIGQEEADNGAILIVAPNERKVRIEVGYGLEPILTDALASVIIDREIVPRFKEGDMAAGIAAGADAIIEQLSAPPEVAEQRVLEAREEDVSGEEDEEIALLILWAFFILFFFALPMISAAAKGKKFRGGRAPVVIWGPGFGGGWGGGGSGGGFGGFSGGGGSFGGGGASGGW